MEEREGRHESEAEATWGGGGREKNHSYVRLDDTLLKEGRAEKKRQDR